MIPESVKPEESVVRDMTIPFQNLTSLPTPLESGQCVTHKHEILICGGAYQRECYSYDVLKDKYKYICSYPSEVTLRGHCVAKRVDKDSNEVTLHWLMMRYVSVWNDNEEKEIESAKTKHCNEWVPFTDNDNKPVYFGRYVDNCEGARVLIGGSNNHLAFITYPPNYICVFNMNTFQYIKQNTLPTDDYIWYHCFVAKMGNEISHVKEKINAKHEMLLFCKETGIAIEYDEDNNMFAFQTLYVCSTMRSFTGYAYVCVNGVILFFGGYSNGERARHVHKYFIKENKWMQLTHTLSIPLWKSVGVLNGDDTCVHILGGNDHKGDALSTHIATQVQVWMKGEAEKQWMLEEEYLIGKEETKRDINEIKQLEIEIGKKQYKFQTKELK
ncbi:hypothetical protein RFI_03892, partial [Reticulomyxa filosa]